MFNYYNSLDDKRPPTLAEYTMAKKELEGFMDKESTLEKIGELYSRADDLILDLVRSEARKILVNDPELDEFVMGMGSCFFTAKEGSKYDINSYDYDTFEEYVENGGVIAGNQMIIHNDHCTEILLIAPDVGFYKDFFEMVDDLNEKSHVKGFPMRLKADGSEINKWCK